MANGTSVSNASQLEVDNPTPTISSFSPSTELAGIASAVVTLTGTGFVPTTIIDVNGSSRATTYINSTQVSVALPSTDFSAAGSLALTAVNSNPGGGTSPAASLAINNPAPGAIKLSPAALTTGATSPVTVTVTGTGFVATSVVHVNGTVRQTTFVNGTTLSFSATVADQATAATLPVTVSNPTPGGGVSSAAYLTVATAPVTPVITSVAPNTFIAGSTSASIVVYGTGFNTNSVIQWNGTNLPTSYSPLYGVGGYTYVLSASIPAAYLSAAGSASITVNTPNASPSGSNAVTVSITNPPAPTLTSVYPAGGAINTANTVTLSGTGFTSATTVAVNGVLVPSTFTSSTQMTANVPSSAVAFPGNYNFTVTTPAPGGGTSAAQVYSAFISIANNDIVYNSADGLIYASVPATAAGAIGNAVVGIDPNTGVTTRTIQVGTTPNKLALSTDGTQLFVGIDGAGAVAQVDLTQGKIVNQFNLGGGSGVYNPPFTATYLAAVPGLPNSVAVATSGLINKSGVTIFDSGVARASNAASVSEGPLSFGASASTLYAGLAPIEALTVGANGISQAVQLATTTSTNYSGTLQYDNGQLYASSGQVYNASSGALQGTFYATGTTTASGPVASDSTLGKAFVAFSSFSNQNSGNGIYVFDEKSFSLTGTIPLNDLGSQGYPTSFRKVVRWGQNGLAVAAVPSSFTSNNQIYIVQSPLVKDVSSSPADLSVSLSAPATGVTGTSFSYSVKVTNGGPNSATGVVLSAALDPSLIINSVTTTQGSCGSSTSFSCDLGTLANSVAATVTVNATATASGTLSSTTSVSASSFDPTSSNNQATASVVITGSQYSAVPSISSISPSLVQAGASTFTLTVNGAGFNSGSSVLLNGSALTTSYVSPTQLTATVNATQIANYGWAPITVSNAAPGGGVSSVTPLTIYASVNISATSLVFDPYGQSLYATIPGTATNITSNSVVPVNPYTATVGTPVFVGSQPTVATETSDGNYLYVGLSGSDSLAQFNLLNQTLTSTIPLKVSSQNVVAYSLAAMPGSDTTLAVGLSGGFGIFDVSGNTGAFRSSPSSTYTGEVPAFGNATTVYSYDTLSTGAEFYRYSINANGLSQIDATTLDGIGGFSGQFQVKNGLVYGVSGGIINPNTTPPSQVQTLPLVDFYNSGAAGAGAGIAADPSLNKDFLLLENLAGYSAYGVARYDLTTYLPEAVLTLPSSLASIDSTWTMLRFGQDGLALLNNSTTYNTAGVSTPTSQVILLRGPFVAPQELSSSTAASLTSSSSSTVQHGSGNTILTLTGSNFLPGVAVTWNGAYRTTTIVDSSHVTINIPASDLSTSGTASLVATNPGASASNTLQITIN